MALCRGCFCGTNAQGAAAGIQGLRLTDQPLQQPAGLLVCGQLACHVTEAEGCRWLRQSSSSLSPYGLCCASANAAWSSQKHTGSLVPCKSGTQTGVCGDGFKWIQGMQWIPQVQLTSEGVARQEYSAITATTKLGSVVYCKQRPASLLEQLLHSHHASGCKASATCSVCVYMYIIAQIRKTPIAKEDVPRMNLHTAVCGAPDPPLATEASQLMQVIKLACNRLVPTARCCCGSRDGRWSKKSAARSSAAVSHQASALVLWPSYGSERGPRTAVRLHTAQQGHAGTGNTPHSTRDHT
jgi:hypothetical protein